MQFSTDAAVVEKSTTTSDIMQFIIPQISYSHGRLLHEWLVNVRTTFRLRMHIGKL